MESKYYKELMRVLIYIEKHLNEELNLELLAQVAGFSKYHFCRIFYANIGERIGEYIKRVRLEKSANRLQNGKKNITEIAIESNYENQASFYKAFKKHFNLSPKEFKSFFLNQPKEFKMLSYEIKEIEPIKVLFTREMGNYSDSANIAWSRLMKFAYSNKIISKESKTFGISHDNPNITEDKKIRYDACISFVDINLDNTEIETKEIEGGKYTIFLHKGAYEKLSESYNYIFGVWLQENNFKLRDIPSFEEYLNRDPRKTKPENLRTKIYIPIE